MRLPSQPFAHQAGVTLERTAVATPNAAVTV